MRFLVFILISLYITPAFSQSGYHRIWGVKENRKMEIFPASALITEDVLYSVKDNIINATQLPEVITETFIEIGASETTTIHSTVRNIDGSWYVIGQTSQASGFTTPNAYRSEFDPLQSGGSVPYNSFLARFSSSGELLWCTYTDWYYGNLTENINIASDIDNNVYFISYKNNDEIIENAPFQSTANPEDFFVGTTKTTTITKLNNNGEYQWSSFFGTNRTAIVDMSCTTDGLIIGGFFASNKILTNIPVSNPNYFSTNGAYQETPNFNSLGDVNISFFVNKFNFDGTRAWGTYYHTEGNNINDIRQIETYEDEIYIKSGVSNNSDNTTTEGAFITDAQNDGSFSVSYLSRLKNDGTELLWRTYLKNLTFLGYTFSINSDGNIWLFGQTDSSTGVATDDAYQTEKNMANTNNKDSYHLLLANDGSTVLYSSYYGFEGDDVSLAIFPAESGYYSVEQTSGNSDAENFITQGNLLELDEEGSSTYGGLVYTYFSTEPVSSGTFDKKKITIYPNPAENVLHLTGEIEGFTKIDIYDMQGQRVFQQPINTSEIVSVDINSLVSGVYLLTISNTTDKQTYRIMKK